MTTAVATPFRFFSLQVVRTERLGPSLARVTFAGPDLREFRSEGRDQSLSLFLPHPGQREPAVPVERGEDWWRGWRELPDDVRAVMRSYTLRALRADADGHTTEIDIDFVLHGVGPDAHGDAQAGPNADSDEDPQTGTHPPADRDAQAGPAARWAARAAAGDRVLLLGPAVADNRAIRFRPPEDTDLVVMWGDETAVPAALAALESLPSGIRARVWLEVPHAGDIQDVTTAADAEITWLVRDGGAAARTPAEDPRTAGLPPAGHPYVWLAGESGRVKELRRHFAHERGVDRRRITFVGYWRRGLTEEELREQEA